MPRFIRNIFITLLISVPFSHSALYANIASVDYIHSAISDLKSITLPIPSEVGADRVTTLYYLMEQIDKSNEILNGYPATTYAEWKATPNVVAAERAAEDIKNLITVFPTFDFTVANISSFDFEISAAGNYTIV